MVRLLLLAFLALALPHAFATQEHTPVPNAPFQPSIEVPGLDAWPKSAVGASDLTGARKQAAGPIISATRQPRGALSGRVVFTSAGHGWAWSGSAWALGRPQLHSMNEDYGNLDQMTLFAFYCFNAGATVVPMRPIGHQTNEVVLDNTSPGVAFAGAWADSAGSVFYGAAGSVPYRFSGVAPEETATATYAPGIPVAGFYPVYAWAAAGANRVNQLYRVRHSGGESSVRVPHRMVGNGWVYLGTYHFAAGSNAATAAVIVSNLAEPGEQTGVVIADAVRFGNGMGDVDRGGGVSRYPREEEASRYWVERSLGPGQSPTIYDNPGSSDANDNVGAPIRMAVEMNREAEGSMFRRIYVSFHSNAGGGRGVMGLYNDPALSTNVARNSNTPNQRRLAQLLGTEVNNDLSSLGSFLEVPWYNRGTDVMFARSDYAFGEINNNTISNEFDATIVEVAFHDNESDARLMRDPKVRNWVARAAYQGVLRYMNQFDGVPMTFLPEPPVNVSATNTGRSIVVSWSPSSAQGGSGAPAEYIVYSSTDGYGFGNPVTVPANGTNLVELPDFPVGQPVFFRVAAANAGGESMPSETVVCRRPESAASSRILLVNGFTRFDRTLNLRQTLTPGSYRPPGHDANSGAIERVLPRRVNSFDYAVPHALAITSSGSLMGFDSCQVQAVTNGTVSLTDYEIVIWAAGNQSTAGRTFNSVSQERISAFLRLGGNLFASGSEIAWDLDRSIGPSAADRQFLRDQLRAALGGSTNDNSGSHVFVPKPASLFAGLPSGAFDDGSGGIYWVGYPDALVPQGSIAVLEYPGYQGGAAGLYHQGSNGGGQVVYFGFPFETILSPQLRAAYMGRILETLSRPARLEPAGFAAGGGIRLSLIAEPGITYVVQHSSDLTTWTQVGQVTNTTGTLTIADELLLAGSRFYRVVRPPR